MVKRTKPARDEEVTGNLVNVCKCVCVCEKLVDCWLKINMKIKFYIYYGGDCSM